MPVCSYVVLPRAGELEPLQRELAAVPGCQVVAADRHPLLLLVTETDSIQADTQLREEIEALDSVQALILTFGEVDPEARESDPLAGVGRRGRGLPSEFHSGVPGLPTLPRSLPVLP